MTSLNLNSDITKSLSKEEALNARKWVAIDASGLVLGRLASQIANILRGKHNPKFTRHVDCGDFVVVTNAGQIKLTGNKRERTNHIFHSGYLGGWKEVSAGELLDKSPEKLLQLAVKRMLPPGVLGRSLLTKLKVYRDAAHPHQTQKPEALKIATN